MSHVAPMFYVTYNNAWSGNVMSLFFSKNTSRLHSKNQVFLPASFAVKVKDKANNLGFACPLLFKYRINDALPPR